MVRGYGSKIWLASLGPAYGSMQSCSDAKHVKPPGQLPSLPQAGRSHRRLIVPTHSYGVGQGLLSLQRRGPQRPPKLHARPGLQSVSSSHARAHVPKRHVRPSPQSGSSLQPLHTPPGTCRAQVISPVHSLSLRQSTGSYAVLASGGTTAASGAAGWFPPSIASFPSSPESAAGKAFPASSASDGPP